MRVVVLGQPKNHTVINIQALKKQYKKLETISLPGERAQYVGYRARLFGGGYRGRLFGDGTIKQKIVLGLQKRKKNKKRKSNLEVGFCGAETKEETAENARPTKGSLKQTRKINRL